jgi:hypothetical protein
MFTPQQKQQWSERITPFQPFGRWSDIYSIAHTSSDRAGNGILQLIGWGDTTGSNHFNISDAGITNVNAAIPEELTSSPLITSSQGGGGKLIETISIHALTDFVSGNVSISEPNILRIFFGEQQGFRNEGSGSQATLGNYRLVAEIPIDSTQRDDIETSSDYKLSIYIPPYTNLFVGLGTSAYYGVSFKVWDLQASPLQSVAAPFVGDGGELATVEDPLVIAKRRSRALNQGGSFNADSPFGGGIDANLEDGLSRGFIPDDSNSSELEFNPIDFPDFGVNPESERVDTYEAIGGVGIDIQFRSAIWSVSIPNSNVPVGNTSVTGEAITPTDTTSESEVRPTNAGIKIPPIGPLVPLFERGNPPPDSGRRGSPIPVPETKVIPTPPLKPNPPGRAVPPPAEYNCLPIDGCEWTQGACPSGTQSRGFITFESSGTYNLCCVPTVFPNKSLNCQLPKYKCVNGVCVPDPNGVYSSLAACNAALIPPSFTGGQCVARYFAILSATLFDGSTGYAGFTGTNLSFNPSLSELAILRTILTDVITNPNVIGNIPGPIPGISSVENGVGANGETGAIASSTLTVTINGEKVQFSRGNNAFPTNVQIFEVYKSGGNDNCGNLASRCP